MMVSTKFHPTADGDVATRCHKYLWAWRRRRLLHDQCPYTPCTSSSWKGLMTASCTRSSCGIDGRSICDPCVKQWRLSSSMPRYLILRMEPVFRRATLRRFCDMRHGVVCKALQVGKCATTWQLTFFPIMMSSSFERNILVLSHKNVCVCVSHLFNLQVYLSHMYIYFLGNLS